jgi:uncharacterized lipoprotein YddW (UPF0748 family)
MIRPGMVVLVAGIELAAVAARSSSDAATTPELESRGVWLDKAQMLEGREDVLARLDRLKNAGLNTIYVAVQIRGAVMYPGSEILPQYDEARKRDPQVLEWLIPAIRERGLRVEAWTEFGFYAYWTPDAAADPSRGAILDRQPELAAIDRDGKDHLHNEKLGDFYALCPSNPESQEILLRLYLEMLGRYRFDGLNLDRIRYPDERFCYCAYCRERFRKDTGLDLRTAAETPDGASAIEEWRKAQLTRFMEHLSRRVRQRFPDVRITSAVVPPGMINEKGQDWPAWIERGYLDAAMPMLYEPDITDSVQWIRRRLGPDALIFVGLDAGQGLPRLTKQIEQLRTLGAPGVTIWYSGTIDPLLPELGAHLFSTPAVSPLYAGPRRGPATGSRSSGAANATRATETDP